MLNLLSGIQLCFTKSTFNTRGNPKLPWKLTYGCPPVARRNFTKKKKKWLWQPLTLLLLLYDLQIKTIKPLLQTDYLNKHKWNTTYHTFVITKASECANLPSIHIYMHTRLTPERGGQSTTIFQGYFTVFPLSLYFNNNFLSKISYHRCWNNRIPPWGLIISICRAPPVD